MARGRTIIAVYCLRKHGPRAVGVGLDLVLKTAGIARKPVCIRDSCLLLVAALATAGIERTRSAGARADIATARKELNDYCATAAESGRLAERATRNTEQTWRFRVDDVIQDG